jgi:uncharacterized protein
MEIKEEYKNNLYYAILALLIVLVLNFGASFLNEIKSLNKGDVSQDKILVVSGFGEVSAVPDIATITFTIKKEANNVADAQSAVSEVKQKVLEVLKNNEIDEKDIKTNSAAFNPKYEFQQGEMICNSFGCRPQPGKSIIVGYEAYENLTVKIRNIDSSGKVIEELGAVGVSDLYGPNFDIDEKDILKEEARREAIKDAREKAEVLAKDLGVRLGKVVSYNESGDYMPQPMMYAKDAMVSAPSANMELSKGENTISSNVSIVYEIK